MDKKELTTRLKKYGFQNWQIENLLKTGKIDTSHGKYQLNKKTNTLLLNEKEVEF